jgi:hypothetical protein
MRLVVLVFAVVLVALPLPPAAVAIDRGVPDGSRHPNVGLLAYDLDGPAGAPPSFLCTGSVLSERVFLTAAHCINAFPGASWSVSLEGGSPTSPAMTPGLVFDDFPFAVRVPTTPAVDVAVHPKFDPVSLAHDVAILTMPQRTFARVKPVRLPPRRLLSHLARRGARVTLVGYGADPDFSVQPPRFVLEGYRQRASAPVHGLTRQFLELDNTTGSGGVCYGDSGGPQLLPGTNIALSHVSTNGPDDAPCTGTALAHRLDLPSERRFIARYLR